MIHECEVTVRDSKFIKLIYKESIKLNKPYNVSVRVSDKLQFYSNDSLAPIGYLPLDGLDVKGVRVWDEKAVKQEAKLENKLHKKNQNKQGSNLKTTKSMKKSKKNSNKNLQQTQEIPEEPKLQTKQSSSYEGFYNFIVYKNGHRKQNDIIILQIHSQSRALKNTFDTIVTNSGKKSGNPLTFQPSKQFNTSLMSSQSPQQRYRGFLNLAMLLLLVLNIRNIATNFKQHGLRQWPALNMPYHSYLFFTFGLGTHLLICFLITQFQFKKYISSKLGLFLNILNILGLLASNTIYSKYLDVGAFASVFLTVFTSIVSLKLISYVHYNENLLRLAKTYRASDFTAEMSEIDLSVKKEIKAHIDELHLIPTFRRFAYFILVPTLCYQIQFPRNSYIRKGWLAKRVVEYLVFTLVMNVLIVQYILPKLEEIKVHFVSPDYSQGQLVIKFMELSVPVLLYWVLMFYSIFQVLLNILAELTCFGDRLFYLDWWNCKDHDEYWKKWNLPVHNWMLRHLYLPLTGAGFSKASAGLIVFFVSAVYHEYLIAVPLQIISYWAFLAMMSQAPLIIAQKILENKLGIRNSELGNLVFWISFCFLGQPLVVFAYYYLYTTKQ